MTHPFYMSIDEIKRMNFKQINAILEEYSKQRVKRNKALVAIAKKYKQVTPVYQILELDD